MSWLYSGESDSLSKGLMEQQKIKLVWVISLWIKSIKKISGQD